MRLLFEENGTLGNQINCTFAECKFLELSYSLNWVSPRVSPHPECLGVKAGSVEQWNLDPHPALSPLSIQGRLVVFQGKCGVGCRSSLFLARPWEILSNLLTL